MLDKLLDIARGEIGYHEKETNANLDVPGANPGDGNYTKYGRDLHQAGYYNGSKNGYAWCDQFVDWCFYQLCGKDPDKAQAMQCQTGPLGAGCKFSAQYYRNAGRFHSKPQVGDQVFFGKTGAETHTGIVEEVHADTVVTIEGNTSDQVARRTYRINNPTIVGYGRPKYETEDKPQSEGEDIVYIVKPRDRLGDIAKAHGTTAKLLAQYNGIKNPNMIVTGQRIRIPTATPAQPTQDKTLDEVAREVIRGEWGNGSERRARLTAAGYDYEAVRKRVNTLLG